MIDYLELNLGKFNVEKVKSTVSYYLRTTYDYYESIEVSISDENSDVLEVKFESPLNTHSRFILEQRIQDYVIESMRGSNLGLI